MNARPNRARGGLEQDVLAVLAATRSPQTAQEVLGELDDGLAYTTVMTTLSRLHAKGALERVARGRAYAYTLPGTLEAAGDSVAARRMVRLLDTGSDRAGVLARFVADLSPKDEKMLERLLRNKDR